MGDLINVVSRAHMAIRIREPLPAEFKDRPGEAPMLRSAILNGANHTALHGGMGVTRGVDADLFHKWLEDQKAVNSPLADLVSEVSDDDLNKPVEMEFGFEPGLERMAEAALAASEGSTITHEGPVSSEEMAAHSDTPNDDTPRGDPDITPTGHSQEPATNVTGG